MNASLDPAALMRRVAEQMCLIAPKAGGAAVSVLTSEDEFVVVSAHGLVESLRGLSLPREGTLQGRAIATGKPQVSLDAWNDVSLVHEVREIGRKLGIRSLIVIPLLHRGQAIGALSLTAADAFGFNDRDVAAMEASGRFISAIIGAHTEMSSLLDDFLNDPNLSGRDATARFVGAVLWPELTENDDLHQRLDDLMTTPANLATAFQPIVDFDTGSAVGFEALSRFPENYGLPPRKWFDIALRLGRSLFARGRRPRAGAGIRDGHPGRLLYRGQSEPPDSDGSSRPGNPARANPCVGRRNHRARAVPGHPR